MSKTTEIIEQRLVDLDTRIATASEENTAEWARLQRKYNLSSFELDHFFQTAHRIGALSAARIELFAIQRELRTKKSFWKKLFRK